MKTKPTVVTLLLLLALVLTLSANNVAIEAHAQAAIGLLQDFCDDYAPVTLVDDDYTALSFVTITDFAGNNYYYSTVNPQGYIIMHVATQKVVEESFDGAGPFADIDEGEPKFYAGPGYYFRKVTKDGQQIYLSSTGEEYELDDEILVSMSTELNTQMSSVDTRSKKESTPNPLYTSTDSDNFTYIKGYEYFEKLNDIYWDYYAEYGYDGDYVNKDEYVIEVVGQVDPQMIVPWNSQGSCGFNALVMVLGYMSVYHNPAIVPSSYVYTVKDSEYYGVVMPGNRPFGDISMDSVPYLPVMSEDLLKDVVCYVYPNYDHDKYRLFGYPAWSGDLQDSMDGYIEEKIPNLSNKLVQHCGTIWEDNTKWDIDNGRPSILSMHKYTERDEDGNIIDKRSGHCMIAYGYKGDMYKATNPNLGNSMFICTGVIFTNYSLEYTGNHVHSTKLRFKNYDCWGTYCPCGYKTCNHDTPWSVDNRLCCSCRTCIGEHNFGSYISLGVDGHKRVCSLCGYIENSSHRISSVGAIYTATSHTGTCLDCGTTFTDAHQLMMSPLGGFYCSCGYSSSNDGEITLGNPNHDGGI